MKSLNAVITRCATVLASLLALASHPAPAAVIDFSSPVPIAGDSDVKRGGGSQVFSYTWGTGATVNGLPFAGTTSFTSPGANLSLSGFIAAGGNTFYSNAAPFNALSTAYTNILKGGVYNNSPGTAGTATLNNLIPGHSYFVQIFVSDPRLFATNRAVDISAGGSAVRLRNNTATTAGGLGQYTYGNFTADGNTQDILFDTVAIPAPDIGWPQINAIQVRDVTGVWSGTTSGDWTDTDTTSQNFSGANFASVKAVATNVYFADLDGAGNAVLTSAITVGAGGVTGVNAVFNNSATTYTLNSADATGITGSYGLTLSGSGVVNLNGANTYSGNTLLNAGTLVVGASGAIGSSAAVVLNGGVLDTSAVGGWTLGSSQNLRGAGTIRGSVTAAGGATINPGGSAKAGTLSITNNLTLNGQTFLVDLNFAPTGGDLIAVGNTLTVNSTCTISLNYLYGTLAGGTYTLLTFPAKAGAGTFALDTTYPGVTLNVNPTSVTLTVAGGGGTSSAFTNLAGGTWSATTNWAGNIIATNVDGVADFSTLDITTARTVTINGVKTIGHMVFGDTVQNANWTLNTGTNILAVSSGSPKLIVSSGQNTTINSTLAGSQGFTKMGAGTLTLGGANTVTGGATILAGAVNITTATALSATANPAAHPVVLSNSVIQFGTSGAQFFTNNLILQGSSNAIVQNAGAQDNFVGTITGSGILRISTPGGVVIGQRGDMSGFTGTVLVTGNAAGNNAAGLIMANGDNWSGSAGSANAVFHYEGGTLNYLYSGGGGINATNYMGALVGSNANVFLQTKNGAGTTTGDVMLEVGALNTSTYFAGAFRDYANVNTGTTPPKLGVRKVGAGTLTLAGANVNTGPTEVRGGTLAIATSLGVTPVTVYSGGTLQLDGSVSSPIVTVQSGGRLVINNGGASLGSAIIQVDGRMDVTPVGGSYYLGAAVLTGSGVVTGAVTVAGGIVNPGTIGTAGRLTITNGDCTVSGGSLRFDLSNNPGSGNDLLDVNGNLDLSTPGVVVSINKLDGLLGGGTYVLAKCSGTLSGDVGNLTPIGAGPLDTLQISGNQLQLVVSAPLNLTWSGDGAGNLWDIGVSTTWLNGATPTTFANGNTTTFNNTGSANSTVNVAATVNPATVVVSGSANYSFVGAGDIGDGASLLKGGTGTLTILNTNTFTGQVFLNSGTLAVGNGSLNGHLSADITNAAALVFNTPLDQVLSNSVTGPGALTKQGVGTLTLTATNARTGPTTIAAGTLALGDGVALNGTLGSGPVTNSGLLAFAEPSALTFSNTITGAGGIVNLGAGTVTLSGVISGSARLTNDFSAGTLFLRGSNSYSGGTWINGGTVVINDTTLRGIGSGNIVIADGTANLQFSGSGSNVVANNISLPTGTTADQFSLPGAVTVRLTGLLTGGAAGQVTRFVNLTAGGDNRGVIILDNPANTFTTIPETYFGTLAFTSDGALGNVNNGVSVNVGNKVNLQFFSRADDGLRFDANNITLNPNRTITLVGNDNINVQGYNGTIAGPVTGLTLNKRGSGNLTVTGPGTLTGSTLVLSGSLLVNNTWTGTNVTVSSGATFGGTGTIDAPISVNSGGTLAPGTSIGTLTVHSNVTLAAGSTTTMEINAASVTSDRVVCLDTVNYSGTLNVLNTGGTLALGQSFQLFSAAGYTNNFTSTSLPALGAGLAWNWNPATGTISVTGGVATNPTNITMTVSGGNMNLSWPADHLGWRLQVQTNSLATGLNSNWSTWPNSTNVTAVSVPINPANPTVFFRLVYP